MHVFFMDSNHRHSMRILPVALTIGIAFLPQHGPADLAYTLMERFPACGKVVREGGQPIAVYGIAIPRGVYSSFVTARLFDIGNDRVFSREDVLESGVVPVDQQRYGDIAAALVKQGYCNGVPDDILEKYRDGRDHFVIRDRGANGPDGRDGFSFHADGWRGPTDGRLADLDPADQQQLSWLYADLLRELDRLVDTVRPEK